MLVDSESDETIFALATPSGSGAIAVVRISGGRVRELSPKIIKQHSKRIPRVQVYSAILADQEIIDYGLATFFEKDKSYTGEDSLEISLHCSQAVLKAFFSSLRKLSLREAAPGEFSKRAYLNGKLDLIQAEAVLDLIQAETLAQASAARLQLEGKLSKSVDDLAEPLRDLLAEIEANIDFPEEDINPSQVDEWKKQLVLVNHKLNEYVDSFTYGRILREGALIVLAGIPNAGKSSLMNALLRDERVIVTDIPGTTRDSIEERIELAGILCRLVDTAGITEDRSAGRAIDLVETIGIKKSRELIKKADLVLFLYDRTQNIDLQDQLLAELDQEGVNLQIIYTKEDLVKEQQDKKLLTFSTKDPASLRKLEEELTTLVQQTKTNGSVVFTNERHKNCLVSCQGKILKTLGGIDNSLPMELISFEIRDALSSLSEIVGNTDVENILGRIFSKFCIGK